MLKSRTRISVTFLRSSPTLPDAIVLDVEMPRMSGPEMIGQLRICKGGEEKIPVLLISAMHRSDFLKLVHQLQLRHSLSKPFDSDELLAAVASIADGSRPVLRRTLA